MRTKLYISCLEAIITGYELNISHFFLLLSFKPFPCNQFHDGPVAIYHQETNTQTVFHIVSQNVHMQ